MNRRYTLCIIMVALLCFLLTGCGRLSGQPSLSAPEFLTSDEELSVEDSEPGVSDEENMLPSRESTITETNPLFTPGISDPATTTETTTTTTTTGTTKKPTTKAPTTKAPTTKKPTTKATTTKKSTTGVTVPQAGNGQVTAQMLSVVETEFLRLVNQERVAVGKKALTVNTALDAGAQIRAQEIMTHFSHTRPDGSDCYTAIGHEEHFWTMGENIAYTGFMAHGYISSADVFTGSEAQLKQVAANAFRQFKESPGHYANMINGDFEQTGIGVLSAPEPALGVPVFYVAHFFGTPWDI